MSLDTLLPLELMRPGEWAEVSDVSGDPSWVTRLAELGVRIGCRLQVLQSGPTCLISCAGTRLSLRGDQTIQVLVRPLSDV